MNEIIRQFSTKDLGKIVPKNKLLLGTSLAVQRLRCTFQCRGCGSIPGWGAEITRLWPKSLNIKQKQYRNKLNKALKTGPHQKKNYLISPLFGGGGRWGLGGGQVWGLLLCPCASRQLLMVAGSRVARHSLRMR